MDGYLGRRPLAPLDPIPATQRRNQRNFLWLMPLLVLGPNIGRFAQTFGFEPARQTLLLLTFLLGGVCLGGMVLGYKQARAQAARDVSESMGSRGG